MDFISILQTVKEYIPIPVIVAVVANIMLVYGSSWLVTVIEEYYEEELGKQIKFFDGKKVWLSAFWCIVLSLTLALAKFIEWRELPFYMFVILGASTFLYEAFLKKIGVKKDAE
jgi:cobalamin synthase